MKESKVVKQFRREGLAVRPVATLYWVTASQDRLQWNVREILNAFSYHVGKGKDYAERILSDH